MKAKKIVTELLVGAGISINGKMPWDIQIHDNRLYQRILSERDLGLGDSYMDGWWDCEALDEFFNRIFKAKLGKKVIGNWKISLYVLKTKVFNRQKKSRSYQVGEQHYDLGNDLYRAMLDTRLSYTCAYWKNTKNLDEAQEAKLDLICKKINLKPEMTVLELGSGWGSFAKYAAEKYGAKIVAVNISNSVENYVRDYQLNYDFKNYHEVDGKYDAVISIGILEHVGYKNYRTYMEVVNRCLKDDGLAFIHTIGKNISTTHENRWLDKYIFPNGMLPSISQIAKAAEGLFVIEDWHNFGQDYDKTLMAWYQNFNSAWPALRDKYGDRFYRMWRFYLLSCAGGFRARDQQLWQIVMTKTGREQPNCRIS